MPTIAGGGNAPFVVFEDADIDAAVEGAMVSMSGLPSAVIPGGSIALVT
jgi:hypothetical protein